MSTAFPRAAAPPRNQEGSGPMKTVIGLMLALGLILTAEPRARAADGKLSVVAAENFYGDVARQIGGDDVAVASVMSNPDQDPHLFETTPSIVKQIAGAQIVILNGADYDSWMDKLLKVSSKPRLLSVAVYQRSPGRSCQSAAAIHGTKSEVRRTEDRRCVCAARD